MTVNEVLARVRKDRSGESTDAEMILWLRQLETRWMDEIVRTHRDPVDNRHDVAFTVTEQDISTYDGIEARVEGHNTRVNGSNDGNSAITVWTASVYLVKDERYILSWDELGGEARIQDGSGFLNLSLVQDGTYTLLMDSVTRPGESVIFQAPASGTYSFSFNLIADGAVYRDWLTRVRLSRDLMIPTPDDEVYIYWLYSKIDFRLGELERYNVDAQMFNQAWSEAAKRYNRQHLPKGDVIMHVAYGRPAPWTGDEDPLNQRRRW